MKVLVTGGAGYIGSVTATALEASGHVPVILDSLLTGPRVFAEGRLFYQGDIADRALLTRVLTDHPEIGCTLHLGARTVVPESVADPLGYYRTNLSGTLELVATLAELGKPRVVFSSSASIYAPSSTFEVDEDSSLAPTSPYARTKMMAEQVLADLADAGSAQVLALRYFNPVGSDPDLRSGVYAPVPTHVVGQLLRAAIGASDAFTITGTDLPTRDGTGIRDYVHVWDVALAHVAAVEGLDDALAGNAYDVLNIGTGQGTTVRELVAAFERVWGAPVPTREAGSRPGDAIGAYANVDRARARLRWTAQHSLDEAIRSALDWHSRRESVLGYP